MNSKEENLQLKDEKIRNWMSVNKYYFIYKHVEISTGDLAQENIIGKQMEPNLT